MLSRTPHRKFTPLLLVAYEDQVAPPEFKKAMEVCSGGLS